MRILGSGTKADLSPVVHKAPLPPKAPPGVIRASSTLGFLDVLGAWKARCGIGRMDYRVDPGLYAVGEPGESSPVLVTANYKMTFDIVRRALAGIDAFVLVLDTKGVNVWCAAGKGSFGTAELVRSIASTGLGDRVGHRDLILPELGAVGVAAHEVKAASGFSVHYGPVRARDIPAYIAAGMKKTPDMARVRFSLRDRLAIIPVELAHGLPLVAGLAAACLLLSLPLDGCARARFTERFTTLLVAAFSGIVIVPIALPYIPFRAFAAKGAVVGALWSLAAALLFGMKPAAGAPLMVASSLALASVPLTAFLAMQYTGASTYTNLRGASAEVKRGLPLMIVAELLGVLGLVAERILSAIAA